MDNKDYFPASDDWVAAMPPVRQNFSSVADTKQPVKPASATVDQEFRTFAALDLSNM